MAVYFEDGPSRRGLVNRLSGADAKAVAQMIALSERQPVYINGVRLGRLALWS